MEGRVALSRRSMTVATGVVIGTVLAFGTRSWSEGGTVIGDHLKTLDPDKIDWRSKDEQYWRSVLTPEQFRVCREAGTERPFSGAYCGTKAIGVYRCSCCGLPLFSSTDKFDSGTGWPSFTEAALPGALVHHEDGSHGMQRVEVRCARCDAHLGHVFDDGPPPSGKRYCINSVCLLHEPDQK